jgi:hypothetical protein
VAEELDDDVHDIPVDTAVLLSIANGYLDAFTYVGHGGVFANAQSGNVILLGAELAHPGSHRSLDHLWPLLASSSACSWHGGSGFTPRAIIAGATRARSSCSRRW